MRNGVILCVFFMSVLAFPVYGKDRFDDVAVLFVERECEQTYNTSAIDENSQKELIAYCRKIIRDNYDKIPKAPFVNVTNKASARQYALQLEQKAKSIIPYRDGEGQMVEVYFDQKNDVMNIVYEVFLKEDETFRLDEGSEKILIQAACVAPGVQKMLKHGIAMRYVYRGTGGEDFGRYMVRKSDCDQVN